VRKRQTCDGKGNETLLGRSCDEEEGRKHIEIARGAMKKRKWCACRKEENEKSKEDLRKSKVKGDES
jgi:hypothetical protein